MNELPTLTRDEADACSSIIHSTTWSIVGPYFEKKIQDCNEEYTAYPPNYKLGRDEERIKSFQTREQAEDYAKSQGWRVLPRSYILKQ